MTDHAAWFAGASRGRLRQSLAALFEDFLCRLDADTLAAAAALHPEAPRTPMPLDEGAARRSY
ncbi:MULTISPECIES: hypothetical protein [Gordonia]|uniref:Uncharacterized protein n=1 Tax=Gordonia amicalis TaxID=89053 RepID=A0AAE4U0B7_9ACTN|nr:MULTISPECIES: hypothetical protein [Gordonia]KAF0969556.1 hypothetical protein BPODLACK_01839 [Gordonia sp. YY1]MCZ0912211.1 hypothetical protein [Gordonia amicalis]MCZ4578259.1 hypothetical protein [Gordonia amicalis]MCZ4653963.1 hypothetical protein [Gordonia amicalis]MDJ0455229.1 hypothetical protein [Gordonia amicalis]